MPPAPKCTPAHAIQWRHHQACQSPLPPSLLSLCVRVCVHLQASFIDFVVYPLWEVWAELVFPHAQFVLDRLRAMQDYWTDMIPTSPNHINSTDEDSAEFDRSPPVTPRVELSREAERC